MKHIKNIIYLSSLIMLFGCAETKIEIPSEYKKLRKLAAVYPKYYMPTVPYNIAPLNFKFTEEGVEFICRLSCGDDELLGSG